MVCSDLWCRGFYHRELQSCEVRKLLIWPLIVISLQEGKTMYGQNLVFVAYRMTPFLLERDAFKSLT